MNSAVMLGFVGRALRVLLGLEPLTTTAYPLRVLPGMFLVACAARPSMLD